MLFTRWLPQFITQTRENLCERAIQILCYISNIIPYKQALWKLLLLSERISPFSWPCIAFGLIKKYRQGQIWLCRAHQNYNCGIGCAWFPRFRLAEGCRDRATLVRKNSTAARNSWIVGSSSMLYRAWFSGLGFLKADGIVTASWELSEPTLPRHLTAF